jgi:hypothetical protein
MRVPAMSSTQQEHIRTAVHTMFAKMDLVLADRTATAAQQKISLREIEAAAVAKLHALLAENTRSQPDNQ